MSVCVVKKSENKIVIAADSQISSYRNKFEGKDRGIEPAKIFQSGEITFGTAGYTNVASMFRLFCFSRKPASADEMGILTFLSEFAEWAKKQDPDFKMYNAFIIIFKGKIFNCDGFEVNEVDNYAAIGCGMFLALGALSMGADPIKAVEVAKKYDLFCGGETISHQIKL